MSNSAPSFVTAPIVYGIKPEGGVRAYQTINKNPVTGERDKNWKTEERQVEIENIRGKENTVTLDTAGFQFFTRPSKHKSFANDEEVEREYYPESAELLKELTGASRVVFFDHTIRRYRPGQKADDPQSRSPVLQAHVDQTMASSIARVHRHLPQTEAPELLKRRFQIVNLWRPIEYPALEWPLALCDYRSVDPKTDVFASALVYPDREGENFIVAYSPNHKWKYVHAMTPDDIVLIKCFDSIQDANVAVFTPHTAFKDPTTPADAPHRQSIELRALVFYD
ncbi:hypothetical protein AMATHDRAFT_142140 [Amanita thiersii Skay4041]|uniref:Methyltransferase n=1 Tax=Amanita thiersii Skay4041 TaxID=703135 RepID=A0A2A9NVC2_9AGAR|nr:hypothetical protein AMATHDRAFT_142140 [Amanita thiersii Skay4041]